MSFEEEVPRTAYNAQQQARSGQGLSTLTDTQPDTQPRPRKGVIVKVIQGFGNLYVQIRFDEGPETTQQSSYPTSFVLDLTPEAIAILYGGIDDLVGRRVIVTSVGERKDQGIATIVNRSGQGSLEKASTLKPFGTLLAPAGSGL